jgi:phosphomannomutase
MNTKHELDWSILREYDIRGIYQETLNEDDAYTIGRAFGTLVKRNMGKTVSVGYDGRMSSPVLESALVNGLVDSGIAVIRVTLGPTPMVYFASKILDTDGAIMVTGSHNPENYNGFKMVMDNKPFYGEDIQKLGKLAAAGDFETGKGFSVYCTVMEEYINRLLQDYSGERELKVAWDTGNGAAGPFVQAMTRQLPGEHIILNAKIDGTFPNHHPDPTVAENLVQLQETVISENCDFGIAFDGDGDRLGVVDGLGRIIWGDQLMNIYSRDVLEANPGATIIADVKSSDHLFKDINDHGGNAIMWRTGHSVIKEKMAKTNALLAGEMSGHIFFNDRYYGFDDALYAGIRLLEIVSKQEKSLAEIKDSMPTMVNTPELRFQCDDDIKFKIIDEVKYRLIKEGAKVNTIDGVRVNTNSGWWLLRASNTQDVLVARCEASNDENLDTLKLTIFNQLKQSGVYATM